MNNNLIKECRCSGDAWKFIKSTRRDKSDLRIERFDKPVKGRSGTIYTRRLFGVFEKGA